MTVLGGGIFVCTAAVSYTHLAVYKRQVQTDAIQGETRGDEAEYSLLFAHAQDTLMTIYSEINIAKQLLKIFSAYEKRISALEK